MRTQPTLRIPFGILGLFVALMVYGGLVARHVARLAHFAKGSAS